MLAATAVAVFIALFVGHSVAGHWVQSSCQAAHKGAPGWAGRWACTKHVIGLTLTKGVVLVPVVLLLDLHVTPAGLTIGLALDAATHWWADRRSTLAWLARVTGKAEFYSLGTGAHPKHPVTAKGEPAATLGTGSYALDQSFHHLWLLVAALIIATV